MNIQARKIKGDTFTSEDILEVAVVGVTQNLINMTLTVEVISGADVTHGGGAKSGEYLHYKSLETDVDDNGNIDYTTNSLMGVSQVSKGASVIRVKCNYLTEEALNQHKSACESWETTLASLTDLEEIEAFKETEPVLVQEYLTTGDITLNWSDLEPYV